MEIGEKIKVQRMLKGYSQKELGELSGISEIAIRKYEAGDRKPKLEQITKIVNALNINPELLLELEVSFPLNTVGDVFSLLHSLYEKVGFTLSYDGDFQKLEELENLDNNSISININNQAVKDLLSQFIFMDFTYAEREEIIKEAGYSLDKFYLAKKGVVEEEFKKHMADTRLLKDTE